MLVHILTCTYSVTNHAAHYTIYVVKAWFRQSLLPSCWISGVYSGQWHVCLAIKIRWTEGKEEGTGWAVLHMFRGCYSKGCDSELPASYHLGWQQGL